MTKNDLNLIGSFIDTKNPIEEFNFAYFGDDGIYASDTKKVICFDVPMLGLEMLLEKRVLKGFIGVMDKHDAASVDGYGFLLTKGVKLFCNTWSPVEVKIPDYKKMLGFSFEKKFSLEDIDDIQFELAQRNCFIDDVHLNPIIQFAECTKFDIFYTEQKDDGDEKTMGMVKIIGLYNDEGDILTKFTSVIVGRTFKSQAI